MWSDRFVCCLLCPHPVGGAGALSGDWRLSSVRLSICPSVCLMSHTSAITRKPKGLGRRNFAQGYPRSHATPTPTSRSKGQKSRSRGGGILWRSPSRTACSVCHSVSVCAADLIETWPCHWVYQLEELVNFRWWSGLRCGFQITSPLPSPLWRGF